MRTLVKIRGLPGSGTSTLARAMLIGYNIGFLYKKPRGAHFEVDMYHMDAHGNYNYTAAHDHAADTWCQLQTTNAMKENVNLIIVSNNFTRIWELEPYDQLAAVYGYETQEIICKGNFRSHHHADQLERMRKYFQYRPLEYVIGPHHTDAE